MAITLNRLYSATHQYNAGTVQINIPFVGNALAVELTTKPEYANTKQVVGTLFQFYGNAQKAYDLFSGRDVVRLELPESDKLWFSPTSYLNDNYTLTIDYTDVGTIINGSNSVSIPEQILGLPIRVIGLEASTVILESDVDTLQSQVEVLESSPDLTWESLTGKPLVFTPTAHSHAISEVIGLDDALDGKANTIHSHADKLAIADYSFITLPDKPLVYPHDVIEWNEVANKPSTFPPTVDLSYIEQAEAPATRSNGSALQLFDRWENTSTGVIGFWSGTYWLSNQLQKLTYTNPNPVASTSLVLYQPSGTFLENIEWQFSTSGAITWDAVNYLYFRLCSIDYATVQTVCSTQNTSISANQTRRIVSSNLNNAMPHFTTSTRAAGRVLQYIIAGTTTNVLSNQVTMNLRSIL